MTDTNPIEDWRVLCELASKERDAEKLIELIVKINRVLEDRHQRPTQMGLRTASVSTLAGR